jgi:predicted transcriptional regulator of viral defense system
LGRLHALRVPAITTADAAAALGLSPVAASQALRRLASAGLVTPIRKGLWATRAGPDPLTLADYVTFPHPSYVSLQTALYLHGMIEQVPNVTYLASLARTSEVKTPVGTFSVHHLAPAIFGGSRQDPRTGVRIATPAKALVDYLYLAPARSGLFRRLPELEIPPSFSRTEARSWVQKIPSPGRRALVARELDRTLASAPNSPRAPRGSRSPRA